MHDKYIRFKLIKNNDTFEAIIDERLSFIENFKLLKNIYNLCIEDINVYDPGKGIFLDPNIAIKEFNINGFKLFYIM